MGVTIAPYFSAKSFPNLSTSGAASCALATKSFTSLSSADTVFTEPVGSLSPPPSGLLPLPGPPNSTCSNSLIYSNSKVNKQFDICNKDKTFSGISDLLITHRGLVDKSKETISIETVSLMDILERYNAPSFIEYLSLGIEGGELEALKTFDFNKYTFGLINIKHNYLEPLRTNIRNLLKSNSYVHVKENKWVDYYKHSSVSMFIHRNNVCPLLYKTINNMKSKKGSIILNHRLDNRPIYTNNTFNVFISSEPEEPTWSNYDMIILPFVSSLPKTIYYPFLYTPYFIPS
jgi:hypothetical protein